MEGLKENLSTEDLLEIISNLNKKLDFLIETMSIPKENFTREEACQYLTMAGLPSIRKWNLEGLGLRRRETERRTSKEFLGKYG